MEPTFKVEPDDDYNDDSRNDEFLWMSWWLPDKNRNRCTIRDILNVISNWQARHGADGVHPDD